MHCQNSASRLAACPGCRPHLMIFLVCFTGTSGLTHYSISLARELSRITQVTLVTGRDFLGEGYPPVTFEVLPLFRRSRWYLLDLLRLMLLVHRRKPKTVLLQSFLKSPLVEAWVMRWWFYTGVKTAMTVHDVLPHYPKPWSALSHRLLYNNVDALIAHSQRTLSDLRAMGVSTPVLVVPHGVYDIFRTRPPQREATRTRLSKFGPDDFVLMFFGKVDTRKGIARFLELRRQLGPKMGYKFVIAGRNGLGPSDSELVAAVDEARKADDCVVNDGNIEFSAVQDYFAMADVIVLPYLEGTTSGVLKLALAFGRPVIATDVGDMAETLSHGIGKLLPADCDAQALAQAVHEVRQDYNRYQHACARALETFGWPGIGQKYSEFLCNAFHGTE